jgi:NDP-sugar pyrophosphorylase family protein
MVLKSNPKREKFTEVLVNEERITGFGEGFPDQTAIRDPHSASPFMFTGIHIFEPRVFDYIPRGVYSDIVPTFYRPAIARGEKIMAHMTDASWFELSTIRRYLDISLALTKNENTLRGQRSSIAATARVSKSILWDDVSIGDRAILNRAIIGDRVSIPPGSRFEDVAIVRADMLEGAEIPEKALPGKIIGENFIVSLEGVASAY